jgi:MtfA peptidase
MASPTERTVQQLVSSVKEFVSSIIFPEKQLRREIATYESIIAPHFPYYTELPPAGRERFLHRVFWFKRKKKFHFKGLAPDPRIPILISACAVQITFGLRKYRMPFFKNIFVLADEYRYGRSQHNWIGHVNKHGIYLSWKHFMQGYSVNGDRYNVGLHEMAHALVYINFQDSFHSDPDFAKKFLHYKQQAESLISNLKQTTCKLFTEQASHNYHECWAESVELFFENPLELRQHYPEIYDHVKSLLNQDPAAKIKVVSGL